MASGSQISLFDRLARVGFLVSVTLIPISGPLSFHVGRLLVYLSDVVFLIVAVLWFLAKIKTREKPSVGSFHWALSLYAAALSLSAIFSAEIEISFLKLFGEFYLLFLAIISYDLVRDRNFVKRVIAAWLTGTAITVIAAITGFALFYLGYTTQADNWLLSHAGSLPAGNYPRIRALFANANMMCNFLNVSLVLSLLIGEVGWVPKWLSRLLTVAIWFAAVLTFSAGLGGMFLSSGLWLSAKFDSKSEAFKSWAVRLVGVTAATLILAAACISPDTPNTDHQITLPVTKTVVEPSVRVLVWENALETIAEHPILGKGTGTDPAEIFYATLSGQNQLLTDAHNMYLSVFAQAGIIGFTAFVFLIYFIVRRFEFNLENEKSAIITALSCAIIGAFLYQGIMGSFEDARHLWILIGLFAGVCNYHDDSDSARVSDGA